MSRDDSKQAGIPRSISELAKIQRRFDTNQPVKSADLAPVIGAVETTYHRLVAMLREKATEEWAERERGGQ